MRRRGHRGALVAVVVLGASLASCGSDPADDRKPSAAPAGAVREVGVDVEGSVQNPAWSPDGAELLVTVWHGGYNLEPADLVIVAADGGETRELVADGWANVNLPGSAWNPVTDEITYSSTEDPHDEIWLIPADGEGDARRVTLHDDEVAYEPSLSPEGDEVVYELHPLDVEGEGRIARSPVGGDEEENVEEEVLISPEDGDCRQPNWSPEGDLVLAQCTDDGGESWTLWVSDPDGDDRRQLETDELQATDASFSPDGTWVVFSGVADDASADLWAVEVDGDSLIQLTEDDGYEGAPSWSPDGSAIAFEASDGEPDGDATTIKVLELVDAVRERTG